MGEHNSEPQIPYGYCQCGCGQKTSISAMTCNARGITKGKPYKYVFGHYAPPKRSYEQQLNDFWNNIIITADDNLCWLWTTGKRNGYGITYRNDRIELSHRIAWSHPDYIIPDGMEVCHSCDNPSCCNPKHLFLGTHQENMDDKVTKGRQAKGFDMPNCKLSDVQITEIRTRYSREMVTQKQLAIEYGVDQSYISYLVNQKKRISS